MEITWHIIFFENVFLLLKKIIDENSGAGDADFGPSMHGLSVRACQQLSSAIWLEDGR